ncbi:paraquat-inducible protein A [Thioclava sp. SK-1]|uniref:paraquat-inducible protein A n=1 Tax=Thioclava sp. SK-1 TaxID=1889770 RepID=UPI000826F8FA|nr:paraquat-inducible protein A [Thioclava sp. SK-1]OCX65288.1 paraquat-inducible protein A [Thioclava sp. SK-1]
MGRHRHEKAYLTAHDAGLTGCRQCGKVWPKDSTQCGRCGAHLQPVSTASLQRVWACWWAGLFCYIPANAYPMLRTNMLGSESNSTIMGGVIDLVGHHNYGIALIVFVASICIPIAKFIAVAYLALVVGKDKRAGGHPHLVIYEIVEFVGRWSMVDVFVVAILSALVQLGAIASIHPGPAAAAFALSVAFTMISAQSFDPRLIWRGPKVSSPPHD